MIPKLEMDDGNEIPQVGLGTFGLNGDACVKAVETALDLGYSLIDTAEVYGNESEIGEAIKDFDRSDLFLSSKVWPINLHHDDLKESCYRSLDKLGIDYLDLYFIHWPPDTAPFSISIEEPIEAMNELVEEGSIRSIGVSNFDISQIKKAMDSTEAPITASQTEFHPYRYDEEILDFCKDNGIVSISYSPLACTKVFEEEIVKELSNKYGKKPAQIVLKWGLQKGLVVVPKASSRAHLKQNLDVFDFSLDKKDLEKIDKISGDFHSIGFEDLARATKFSIKEMFRYNF